jgi:hypothetical protein
MSTLKYTLTSLLFLSFSLLHSQPVTWDPSTSYSTGALVIEGTSTYIATTSVPANNTPPNNTYWKSLEETAASLTMTTAALAALPTTAVADLLATLPGAAPDANSTTGTSSTSKIINISTNGYSEAGAQKMSAGFIITGTENLKVYIKAEKSQEAGITPLTNPKLQIWNISRTSMLYENDNWGTNSNVSEINALGGSYPPIESTDAAVLVTLAPGAYLADVFGAAGNTGKALVAVNNVDSTSSSQIINISTNGYAYTGAQKMSAGFIITGTEDVKVYIKAEKSQEAGITPLTNPKLQIWNISRTSMLYENDNWGTNTNVSDIQALGGSYPPIESTDAAVLVTLSPGAYLADVFGAAGNSGKALVAINKVD